MDVKIAIVIISLIIGTLIGQIIIIGDKLIQLSDKSNIVNSELEYIKKEINLLNNKTDYNKMNVDIVEKDMYDRE